MSAPGDQGEDMVATAADVFPRKEFDTLRARFAMLGFELSRVFRVGDGRPAYHVTRNGSSRVFSHPHDLQGHLSMLESVQVGRPVPERIA
jgi:hypothetical protein